MGFATNIIVMMFVLSFALYLGTPDHSSTAFMDLVTDGGSLMANLKSVASITTITLVAVGLFGQSATHMLFAGIVGFLITFFTMPTGILTSAQLPNELKILLAGVFGVMYVMALLSFFKGTGDP